MSNVRDKIKKAILAINKRVFEREDIVEACFLALLAKEHIQLVGAPGSAKSLLARSVAAWLDIRNGKTHNPYFELTFSKTTKPEEIFGPVDVAGLQKSKYRRLVEGNTLPNSVVAYLNEVWKGSSAVLNGMLTVLNERRFHNGTDGVVDIPLRLAIVDSNEYPSGQELEALADRFLFRFHVDYLESDGRFLEMLKLGDDEPVVDDGDRIDAQDLVVADKEVAATTIGKDVELAVLKLKMKLEAEGHTVSDRRWKKSMKVLRAYAWLLDKTEVEMDHMAILGHILWFKPDSRSEIRTAVLDIAAPELSKVYDLTRTVEEIVGKWQTSTKSENLEQAKQLRELKGHLMKIQPKAGSRVAVLAADTLTKIDVNLKKIFERTTSPDTK